MNQYKSGWIFATLFIFLFQWGCTSNVEPVLTNITPQNIRVQKNEIATVSVFFQKQYQGSETLEVEVSFLDPGIATLSGAGAVTVLPGSESFVFNIQGVKAGTTWVFVSIKGRDGQQKVKAPLEVK